MYKEQFPFELNMSYDCSLNWKIIIKCSSFMGKSMRRMARRLTIEREEHL